ncbi:hypothetical protein A3K86_16790 [Photobacterium jeanii]|uniref:Beta-lactamase-related domain-containing protein n=1 Tax=Photobacterium jeanii TaxID=858640 RepID=A0A178K7I8_9GAMM|nr:serine hydrolase [Photobacterium jeanii]OAN13309.1 hypothetical protein A3K86_16790 [Photobacterium jeanii]
MSQSKCFVLLLIITALIGCKDQSSQKIQHAFSDISSHTPGCAVGIIKNDRLAVEEYYGSSSLRYKVPITEKTIFNIGSISKHITTFLVLKLEQEGKLSRSDNLKSYYPDAPDWFEDITIYHLIHHQSGLPDYLNNPKTRLKLNKALIHAPYLIDGVVSGVPIPTDVLTSAVISQMKSLSSAEFKSGFLALYSNTGYLMLANIIEKVSGESFRQLAEREVFHPLGMKSTTINGMRDTEIPWRATGYIADEDGQYFSSENYIISQGDGGVLTTLQDYAKWVQHMMKPHQDEALWEVFLNPNDPEFGLAPTWNNSRLYRYSNGLIVSAIKGANVYTHGGYSLDSMKSDFWFSPKLKLGYIQLCNYNTSRRVSVTDVIELYSQ